MTAVVAVVIIISIDVFTSTVNLSDRVENGALENSSSSSRSSRGATQVLPGRACLGPEN